MDMDLRRKTLRNLKKEGSFMSFVKSKCFWRLNLEYNTKFKEKKNLSLFLKMFKQQW